MHPQGVSAEQASTFAFSAIAQEAVAAAGSLANKTVVVIGGGPHGTLVAMWSAQLGPADLTIVSRRPINPDVITLTRTQPVVSSAEYATDEILRRTGGWEPTSSSMTQRIRMSSQCLAVSRRCEV